LKNDHQARIGRLQEHIRTEGLDAFVVSTQDSIYYLTGISYMPLERPFFIIVRGDGAHDLVVPRLELEHVREAMGAGRVVSYFEFPSTEGENWFDVLNEMLRDSARVAVEPDFPASKMSLLRVGQTVVSSQIQRMRMVKGMDEIEAIRVAAAYTDEGMRRVHRGLYRGQSVLETTMPARGIQTAVLAAGEYDYFNCGFLTAGWPAPKSSQPHSLPALDARMGPGPIVLMSFNRVNGYAAECERTVFLGEPSDRDRELFILVMEARSLALGMVKPGVRCADIDAATRGLFASRGLAEGVIHRTGHGIGLGNHEQPWLSVGSADVLEEGMVISVEPGLYFSEIGGFRHSDTVLVTRDGHELVTKYPADLTSLVVRRPRPLAALKGWVVRKAVGR
jgi:Xaa-Pro dipeptidase